MTNTHPSERDTLASHAEAVSHLRKTDPVLGALIDRAGPYTLAVGTDGSHFDVVARAIVHQQLSGKAAEAIYKRFTALFGDRPPLPGELADKTVEEIRSAGLSGAKAAYLKDLGERVAAGEVAVHRLHEMPDDEVIAELTRVRGIGVWTAQMFLIFRLGRPDVLPDLDLGIRKAVQRVFGLPALASPEQVRDLGARWSPYSTVASWYLWRSLELDGTAEPEVQ